MSEQKVRLASFGLGLDLPECVRAALSGNTETVCTANMEDEKVRDLCLLVGRLINDIKRLQHTTSVYGDEVDSLREEVEEYLNKLNEIADIVSEI